MSNHRIDDIFRNKLLSHQVNPPANAWPALLNQLKGKKKRNPFPYKIAASLLFIGLTSIAGYLILNSGSNIRTSDVASAIPSVTTPPSKSEADIAPFQNAPQEKSFENENFIKPYHYDLELLQPVYGIENQITAITKRAIIRQIPYNRISRLAVIKEEESLPPVTISYKSGNKMLNDDATSEPEKESTLRRAWDYALSVKNGEERPFNIKEMKNELFASDFKKKKSKSQD